MWPVCLQRYLTTKLWHVGYNQCTQRQSVLRKLQLEDYCETLTKVFDACTTQQLQAEEKNVMQMVHWWDTSYTTATEKKKVSIWRKSELEVHRMIYNNHRNEVNQAIRGAKCDYYMKKQM